jgi:hypothetical protein
MNEEEDAPDPALYAPGTHGCHEALHMAYVLAELVDRQLCTHPAVALRPEWRALAEKACDALNDLYQAIGRDHLGEPS